MLHTKESPHTLDFEALITHITSRALFLTWAVLTVLFALAYFFLSTLPGHGPTPLTDAGPVYRFFETLYFSVIIGTTTGLGDIIPHGLSRLVAAVQTISSFILLAAFVAKFAARKQEKVLDDIHQLSFDSSFHAIRNGLFVARNDIDIVIKKVLLDELLDKKDWLNLKTTMRQMQIYIKHIPDFYQKTQKTHDFDVDREMLLIDSLQRTLTRLAEALDVFKEKGIKILYEERFVRELHSLLRQIETMSLHEEQKTLDPENHEALQEILICTQNVRSHLSEIK